MSHSNWTKLIRKWSAALAIFAMMAGGIGIASVMIFSNRTQPSQPTAAPRSTLAPPPPSVPTPREFSIGVVVTAQNCAPDTACTYTYSIEPKYLGLHPLPETPFTVKYEVNGGHVPQPGEFTVQDGQARILKDVVVDGPAGARLQAAVTEVVG